MIFNEVVNLPTVRYSILVKLRIIESRQSITVRAYHIVQVMAPNEFMGIVGWFECIVGSALRM